jgi:PAS domain S-box-containing protein
LAALVITTVVGAYFSNRLTGRQREWTSRVAALLTATREASDRYAEMEAELRAYEITRAQSYLEAYKTRREQAQEGLARLREITVADFGERQLVDQMDSALAQRAASADRETEAEAGRARGSVSPDLVQMTNADEKISQQFRRLVSELDANEARAIAIQAESERWLAFALGILATMANVAAASGVALSLRASIQSRRETGRADRERNEALVRERDALKRVVSSEERALETLDSISDGLFVLDSEFRYFYVNPQIERLAGKPKRELLGKTIWDAFPEIAGSDFETVYRAVMTNREPAEFEAVDPLWDHWVEVRVFPNRHGGGLTVSQRDISELKSAREQQAQLLREVWSANDLLQGIMEGSSDLIASIDAEYRYVASNQAYRSAIREMAGVELAPGMNVNGLRFQQPLQARAALAAWRLALQGGESTTSEEFVVAGGARRTFEVHYSPVRDASGMIAGASAIARDITERRMAEKALLTAHEALNNQVRQRTEELQEKEMLLKEVHHRVKNNLQVVSSLLSMQRNLVADEAAREAFRQSENRILSMAMIHEFLYQNSNFSELDLIAYLRRVADHLAASYSLPGVECRVTGTQTILNLEKAIPCGLIVNELVSNCFKHAFPNGRTGAIEVQVNRENGVVTVSVSDNGAGLPPDFQIPGQRSLGLKVVQTLATRQLHGKLEYARENGSRIWFSFEDTAA